MQIDWDYTVKIKLFKLQEDFAKSNIPFKIDIIYWDDTTKEFINMILKNALRLEAAAEKIVG